MNQGKIEEVIRNIIAQEVGNNVSQKPVVAGQIPKMMEIFRRC